MLNAAPGQTIPRETRARVREAADALGYVPHGIARALREGTSRIVLLNAGRLRPGGSLQSFIAGLETELAAHGHTLLVRYGSGTGASGTTPSGGAGAPNPGGGARPAGAGRDGLSRARSDSAAALRRVVEAANPRAVVDLDQIYADDESDLRDGGWHDGMAAHADTQIGYLADRGHTRIAFAAPADPALTRFAALRLRHARSATLTRGLPGPLTISVTTSRAETGSRLRALLTGRSAPTAVAAFDDDTALRVLTAFVGLQRRAPDDLAVIGFDDTPYGDCGFRRSPPSTSTPLATVGVPRGRHSVWTPVPYPLILRRWSAGTPPDPRWRTSSCLCRSSGRAARSGSRATSPAIERARPLDPYRMVCVVHWGGIADIVRETPMTYPTPFSEDPATATRHLCAAAYLDDTFRDEALREIYHQPRRIVAPSHGFNVVPVIAHCLRARAIAVWRDLAIVVTLGATFCLSMNVFLYVLINLVTVQLYVSAWRFVRDTVRRLRDGAGIDPNVLLLRGGLLLAAWAITALLSIYLNLMMLAQAFGTDTGDISPFEPGALEALQQQAQVTALVSLAVLLMLFLFPIAWSLWRQLELQGFRPGLTPGVPVDTTRLREIDRQQYADTIVYAGFRPYVGAGEVVRSWGFAQRLVRPVPDPVTVRAAELGILPPRPSEASREFPRPPFEAAELVGHLRDHLGRLVAGPGRSTEETIAGMTVRDTVMLSGTEVSYLAPYTAPETVNSVIRHPVTPARHALTCRVVSWGGEVVTSVHVHVAVQGRSLYLEVTTTALGPCYDLYRTVSQVDGSGPDAWARALRRGLAETPRTVAYAPRRLVRALIQLAFASGGTAGTPQVTRGYDYGARIGLRELGSPGLARNLVQIQDVEKFRRLIERRTIAAVLDFLDTKGVDTEEYRDRANSALNISGSNIINNSKVENSSFDARNNRGATR
ncbi:substrate-binding domain-containing protein [Catenuloplanes japonicus]|uniref:substrate-binding domain-containing protein n=1 Tax=Catenuloplanes japonicus TaxID=33876 RepID=UPI0012FA7233|nr:LacI family DNA-binding transcriptional regulator [Catenuloplanes japonicus]